MKRQMIAMLLKHAWKANAKHAHKKGPSAHMLGATNTTLAVQEQSASLCMIRQI